MKHIFLFFFLCLFLTPLVRGETEELYQNIKRKIVEDDVRERKLKSSLYIINERMREMSSKMSAITDQILSTQLQAEVLARRMAALEEKEQLNQKELSKRLRLIYQLSHQFPLKVLFSSKNPHELSRNLLFLKKLSHRDLELIKSLKENVVSLQISKTKLKKKVRRLLSLKVKLKAQEKNLESDQKYKIHLISRVKRERAMKVSEVASLRGRLDKEQIYLSTSFFERKGQITHPVRGWLSDTYGVIQDPVYKYLLTHKGYFYRVSIGSLVHSVHSGRVAYTGVIEGYGKTVIVDHGDHYYTVYAGHQSVQVSEGQEVKEGTLLGQVGFSKRHGKAGIYFEIRHFSDSVDPTQWLVGDKHYKG